MLGASDPGLLVAFKERLPVLDYVLCHGTVTNSISNQPEGEEAGQRLHLGSVRQRDQALGSWR